MNITYLRIENGFDISKITGAIPQNIGEGYQFNLAGKQYTTIGSYTKDKKETIEYRNQFFLWSLWWSNTLLRKIVY